MQVFSLERANCSSVRPRRSESALIEEQENEAKLYRALLSLFADNLNATLRSHRDCLGDIDYYPRIKISREEQLALQDCLEKVISRQEEKLSKDGLARNGFIRRSQEEYLRIYRVAFPESGFEGNESKLLDGADFEQFRFRKTLSGKKFSCPTPVAAKRPLSSKPLPKGKGLAGITQVFQLFQASTAAQTYKLKTISAQLAENPEKKDKGFILTNRSKEQSSKKTYSSQKKQQEALQMNSEEDVNFTGNQIVINERKTRYSQQDQRENQRGAPFGKLGNKRMANLKFPQRKSIEEIEKMQIQNRIMMVNSVLSVNLAPPQPLGYRPKSRCWQNYFN